MGTAGRGQNVKKHRIRYIEAKQNIGKHSELSVETLETTVTRRWSSQKFATMIGFMIDTFRNTTYTGNRKHFQKSRNEAFFSNSASCSYIYFINYSFLGFAIWSAKFRIVTVRNSNMNKTR